MSRRVPNLIYGKALVLPKCVGCGYQAETNIPVLRPPDERFSEEYYEWLCGSCLYREENPQGDTTPPKPLPRSRRARLQTERLFLLDDEA